MIYIASILTLQFWMVLPAWGNDAYNYWHEKSDVQRQITLGSPRTDSLINLGLVIGAATAVSYTGASRSSGSLHVKWISQYFCHLPYQVAENWCPSILSQYVCTCKDSASYIFKLSDLN